ncbi:hypothetical protein HOC37_00665 [bacterium]|nr:hypothetical protein [bacterium]MBT5988885.1 hypothetical protein [bacterium]
MKKNKTTESKYLHFLFGFFVSFTKSWDEVRYDLIRSTLYKGNYYQISQ